MAQTRYRCDVTHVGHPSRILSAATPLDIVETMVRAKVDREDAAAFVAKVERQGYGSYAPSDRPDLFVSVESA